MPVEVRITPIASLWSPVARLEGVPRYGSFQSGPLPPVGLRLDLSIRWMIKYLFNFSASSSDQHAAGRLAPWSERARPGTIACSASHPTTDPGKELTGKSERSGLGRAVANEPERDRESRLG